MPWHPGTPLPSLDEMETLARDAFQALPESFRALTGGILFAVQDFPDTETVAKLGLENGLQLLGLFHGAPLSAHLTNMAGPEPTRITLYRMPILNFWADSPDDLPAIVRHVLVHEIGHHFGLSDADMEAIEAAAD